MQVSPSIVYRCIDLIGALAHHGRRRVSDIEQLDFAGTKSSDVISALSKIGWIELFDDQYLQLSERSRMVYDQSPSRTAVLRPFLLDFVDAVNPPWLQIVPRGRAATLTKIDDGVQQLFVDAGLTDGTGKESVEFWDALAAKARGLKNEYLNAIGRNGERHSFENETKRTGRFPQWVAIDDSTAGYDILSVVSNTSDVRLRIEVKASNSSLSSAAFFVSRNEWEVASGTGEHLFHLWNFASCAPPRLAVLTVRQLRPHIPLFAGHGKWTAIEIPFRAFDGEFKEVK